MRQKLAGLLVVLALTATIPVIGAAPASAGQTGTSYGWLYRSSDSDCTYYEDNIDILSYAASTTTAFLGYSILGVYTFACSNQWNRPAGNLLVKMNWYREVHFGAPGTLCAWIDWQSNPGLAARYTFTVTGNQATMCGMGWPFECTISIDTFNYAWNGAWHGGFVGPAAHADGC